MILIVNLKETSEMAIRKLFQGKIGFINLCFTVQRKVLNTECFPEVHQITVIPKCEFVLFFGISSGHKILKAKFHDFQV